MIEVWQAALLVAVIGGIVDLDSTATWQFMVSQPVVAAPLTGLFLGYFHGDVVSGLRLGLMIGTILQLVWIEQLPLGMNIPPDAALASVLSVALGYLAGRYFESYVEREVCNTVALLIAVGLGLLGRSLDIWIRRLNTSIDNWVAGKLEAGAFHALDVGHSLGGFLTFLKAFLFCFVAVLIGVEPLRTFTQSLNISQNTGFIVIEGLLPAVGFAVLASRCLQTPRELQVFLLGVAAFTLLPAWFWLPVIFGLGIGWYSSRSPSNA
ncbi:MAG TPA: PTS sugar transporter subunit IIC [Candidatus Ozemobacteraceae bacterium]|nr:PTS sugar transporter subunit IIC [Candidatus Ozemobacteraceae bacterium]